MKTICDVCNEQDATRVVANPDGTEVYDFRCEECIGRIAWPDNYSFPSTSEAPRRLLSYREAAQRGVIIRSEDPAFPLHGPLAEYTVTKGDAEANRKIARKLVKKWGYRDGYDVDEQPPRFIVNHTSGPEWGLDYIMLHNMDCECYIYACPGDIIVVLGPNKFALISKEDM